MKRTDAQILLGKHLKELGLGPVVYELKFCDGRKFAFDLACPDQRLAFECNGHWKGHHGAGWSKGYEKTNLAQMLGWRVFTFANSEVLKGKAKEFLSQWLSA